MPLPSRAQRRESRTWKILINEHNRVNHASFHENLNRSRRWNNRAVEDSGSYRLAFIVRGWQRGGWRWSKAACIATLLHCTLVPGGPLSYCFVAGRRCSALAPLPVLPVELAAPGRGSSREVSLRDQVSPRVYLVPLFSPPSP